MLDKINKLTLPATILIASIIIGGFIYASQVSKQKSIEAQQQIELQAKKEADQVKAEQDKRDYIAKRKVECLAIYKTESDKFSNVQGWDYIEPFVKKAEGVSIYLLLYDKCEIFYKDNKTGKDFSKFF